MLHFFVSVILRIVVDRKLNFVKLDEKCVRVTGNKLSCKYRPASQYLCNVILMFMEGSWLLRLPEVEVEVISDKITF